MWKLLFDQSRGLFVASAIMGVLGGAANAWVILLISDTISTIDQGQASVGLFAQAVLLALVFGVLAEVCAITLAARLTCFMRTSVAQLIAQKPLIQLETMGAGRILATFTDDIPAIANGLIAVPALAINLTIVLGCTLYLGVLSPLVLFALLATLGVGIGIYLSGDRMAARYMEEMRRNMDELMIQFSALNEGIKELKLHYSRCRAFFNEALNETTRAVARNSVRCHSIYAFFYNWVSLVYFVFVGLLLFGFSHVLVLETKVTIGFALVVLYMRQPIIHTIHSIPTMRRAGVAFKTLGRLGLSLKDLEVKTMSEDQVFLREIAEKAPFESLSLHNATHHYFREREASYFTLGPVDFSIKAGELVFIVGGNGSGKTTLAKLICGLYAMESGELKLNGIKVTDRNMAHFQQYFSVIFSDFFVFEQILGLDKKGLDERASAYARKLQVDHKISFQDGRLSTTNLSTGQRKRIALLTNWLDDRDVYLFDEWAADQDPEFKQIFYYELLPEMKANGKALIVISHDERYFHLADRIIHMTEGQITNHESNSAPSCPPGPFVPQQDPSCIFPP